MNFSLYLGIPKLMMVTRFRVAGVNSSGPLAGFADCSAACRLENGQLGTVSWTRSCLGPRMPLFWGWDWGANGGSSATPTFDGQIHIFGPGGNSWWIFQLIMGPARTFWTTDHLPPVSQTGFVCLWWELSRMDWRMCCRSWNQTATH